MNHNKTRRPFVPRRGNHVARRASSPGAATSDQVQRRVDAAVGAVSHGRRYRARQRVDAAVALAIERRQHRAAAGAKERSAKEPFTAPWMAYPPVGVECRQRLPVPPLDVPGEMLRVLVSCGAGENKCESSGS